MPPPDNDNQALTGRISDHVDGGREILMGSNPLTQPDSSVSPINEDGVFRFSRGSEDIVGFDDPNGNSDNAGDFRHTHCVQGIDL